MGFITMEEIIHFAVQREKRAYELYCDAAAKSNSIASRKMFEEMAAEEAGHQEVFSRIEMAAAVGRASAQIPDTHISAYLVDLPLRPDMSYDEIIRYGIKTEENAWKLYVAAAEVTEEPQLKKTLLAFAEVERGHKKRLETLYEDKVLTEN